jgi:hypothetical protein
MLNFAHVTSCHVRKQTQSFRQHYYMGWCGLNRYNAAEGAHDLARFPLGREAKKRHVLTETPRACFSERSFRIPQRL